MPSRNYLFIKFYFLVVMSVALMPALLLLMSHPRAGSDVVSAAGAVQIVPVDGWVLALSTDTSTVPVVGTNVQINASGTLEFLNVVPNAGNPSGPGWIALTHTTGTARLGELTLPANYYGLTYYITDIPTGVGYFEGYIWSSNFGWIEFATSTAFGCPSGSCTATIDATGRVHGWARILSIKEAGGDIYGCGDAGGWASNDCYKGWIKLGWETGDPANGWNNDSVRIQGDGTLTGYAWSNEFGWFKFIGRAASPPPPLVATCNLTANPDSVQVTQTMPTATTSVAWACIYTNNDCTLSGTVSTTTQSYGNVATSSLGWIRTLGQTTRYTVACTSAVNGSSVSASGIVSVKHPSVIIECNPGSPNCK